MTNHTGHAYRCEAFPDGRWEVYYHADPPPPRTHASTIPILSGKAVGLSVLERFFEVDGIDRLKNAEAAANSAAKRHAKELATQRKIKDGRVTFFLNERGSPPPPKIPREG